jgi:ABC-2 type transport system ATP-binding protein
VLLLTFAADGRSSDGEPPGGRLREQQERAIAALRGLAPVRDVALVDEGITVIAPDGGAAVPPVLETLKAAGLPVARLSLTSPTLDDVFLRHTGRTIRQEELNLNWRSSRNPWGGGRGPWGGGRRRRP